MAVRVDGELLPMGDNSRWPAFDPRVGLQMDCAAAARVVRAAAHGEGWDLVAAAMASDQVAMVDGADGSRAGYGCRRWQGSCASSCNHLQSRMTA